MLTDNRTSKGEGSKGAAQDATPESLARLHAALTAAVDRVEVLEDKERRATATARLLGLDVMILSRTFSDRLRTLELMVREMESRGAFPEGVAPDREVLEETRPAARVLEIEAREEETREEEALEEEALEETRPGARVLEIETREEETREETATEAADPPDTVAGEGFEGDVFEDDAPLVLSYPLKETRTRRNRVAPYLAIAVAAIFILVAILYAPRRESVPIPPSRAPRAAETGPAVVDGHMLYGAEPLPAALPAPPPSRPSPAPAHLKAARSAPESAEPDKVSDQTTSNRAAGVAEQDQADPR